MREVTFREAVRDGLAEELERDERVMLLGEDISLGGVFNATPGLQSTFGPDRVIDTPISELAFTGAAFGAAVKGLRPVVEIMFGDFLGLVVDTLVNQASKYWYLTNEQASVPLVVRSAVGAGARLGACHSQIPTSLFMGEPGLTLVAPSTPADAKGLLKSAIRYDNPVVVFEHKLLYGRKGDVPDGDDALVPLGRATVRRSGTDVTVVAAMRAVELAIEAAETLAEESIAAEVIDLRTLRPLDATTVVESVARTGRLVVVEEGPPSGGYAADVIAAAIELGGPVAARRVTMPDLPIPFASTLEDAALPSASAVAAAVRALS
ncbi:MAG TPA: transketolase C-terminal domain-containing protein [Gaiellaceae bacterium]|nr:transketolase C-terminal domain-containing protein [Gaiellaceae bacterium]